MRTTCVHSMETASGGSNTGDDGKRIWRKDINVKKLGIRSKNQVTVRKQDDKKTKLGITTSKPHGQTIGFTSLVCQTKSEICLQTSWRGLNSKIFFHALRC